MYPSLYERTKAVGTDVIYRNGQLILNLRIWVVRLTRWLNSSKLIYFAGDLNICVVKNGKNERFSSKPPIKIRWWFYFFNVFSSTSRSKKIATKLVTKWNKRTSHKYLVKIYKKNCELYTFKLRSTPDITSVAW